MHFGATIREILSASCGSDLRRARPRTPLPVLESAGALRALGANLELTFGIEISEPDLAHLHTVRDVLQCVRLRLWEKRVSTRAPAEATPGAPAPAAQPLFVTASREPGERFIRYTRPAPLPTPALAGVHPKRI
jgi:hypothetical protein